MIHKETRSEQTKLFSREGDKQDAALLLRLSGEPARQLNDARGAGGVVVGAGMHSRARERGRHGEQLAHPEVVEVRTNHEIFVRFAGEISSYVVDGLDNAL